MPNERHNVGLAVGASTATMAGVGAFVLWGLPTLFFVIFMAFAGLALFAPGTVALVGISVIYLNLPGVAVTVHGLPTAIGASSFLLLVIPLLVRLFMRREVVLLDRPLLLIVAFLGAVLLSSFGAQDSAASTAWLTTFLAEGLLMYFLVLNLFRSLPSLRHAIDALMICGALLASLTIYQEATHSYAQRFSGLAQRKVEIQTSADRGLTRHNPFRHPDKIHLHERAGGPIGDPNRYAQVLIVLIPLVYFRMRTSRTLMVRLLCAACGALILGGSILTYSRGGFVGLLVLVGFLALTRSIRLRELGIIAAMLLLVVTAWAPGYILRLDTLRGVSGFVEEAQSADIDAVIRGRLTEMLAALNLFLDHPLLGVGPGQFEPVYSANYMNNPDIALRRITTERRAHSLYLELAAETGLLGTVTFLLVVGLILSRLWRLWGVLHVNRREAASLAAGFFLSIVSYLVTAIFLHLAYQRYYWLLLGLAGATLQVLSREKQRSVAESAQMEPAGTFASLGRATPIVH